MHVAQGAEKQHLLPTVHVTSVLQTEPIFSNGHRTFG